MKERKETIKKETSGSEPSREKDRDISFCSARNRASMSGRTVHGSAQI